MSLEALRGTLDAALEAGDATSVLRLLEVEAARGETSVEFAKLLLETAAAVADAKVAQTAARRLARAHPRDALLLALAARVLVLAADGRPRDEPRLPGEDCAEDAAAFAFQALSLDGEIEPELLAWLRKLRANALRLAGPERDDEARGAFEEALRDRRDDGHLWFDYALLHKWRGRFQAAMDCNLRAQARLGDTRALLFNLGIAATAVGDGNVAGLCWKKLGFPVSLNEKSGHAFVPDLPEVEVRVISRGAGYGIEPTVPDQALAFEVVWVVPLSPVHGVVSTPSFRDAPIDYGDVVLWDAAPASVDASGGAPRPRFPLLEILRRGDESRLRFVALEQQRGDVAALESSLPEGCKVFVQREQVSHVCSLCAAGDSMRKHEHLPAEEHRLVYGKIVAPASVKPTELHARLDASLRASGKVRMAIPELYEKMGDTKRAGQEHQAFRTLERIAIKRDLVGGAAHS